MKHEIRNDPPAETIRQQRRRVYRQLSAAALIAGLFAPRPRTNRRPTLQINRTKPDRDGTHPGDTGKRRRRRERGRRLEMAKLTTAGLCIALMAGCETRSFTTSRPDGTTIKYTRSTLFGESTSEGVTVSRTADELAVEVGSTGSKTDAQIAIEAFGIGLQTGRAQTNPSE